MTPTNQEKLDEMYEMIQENNKILRSLLRRERFATFMRIIYWMFIIATIFGLYYYVQPVFNKFLVNFDSIQKTLNSINGMGNELPETKTLQSFLDFIKSFFNK